MNRPLRPLFGLLLSSLVSFSPALIPWTPIRTNGTRANGQFLFADPNAALFPQRFFRVGKP